MNLHCAACGAKGTKKNMIVSKVTKKAYCFDEIACAYRRVTQEKELAQKG